MTKKQVISPSQAILLLLDQPGLSLERVEELEKFYLMGVQLNAEGKQDPASLAQLKELFENKLLAPYSISYTKKTINDDPTRRYFETHIAYETVKRNIDNISIELLQAQVAALTRGVTDPETADKCRRAFAGELTEKDEDNFFEYSNYISKIKSGELFSELDETQRGKIVLLVQSSLLGVANALSRGRELPIDIYGKGLYSEHWKGKEKVEDQRTTLNANMGLMKSHMPLPATDIAVSETPAPPLKPSDQATYRDDGKAKWVEMSFNQLVHPFSNAISGTVLTQLRSLADLRNKGNATAITDSAENMEQYFKLLISTMVYGSGGHTLNEFTYPLQLDEVRQEFEDIEGFENINMWSMFFTNNNDAFIIAAVDSMDYNNTILSRQAVNQSITELSSLSEKSTINLVVDHLLEQKAIYNRRAESRGDTRKVDLIGNAIDKIIEALQQGNIEKSKDLSEKLLSDLEQSFGTKSFLRGEKKSYKMAKDICELLTTLHESVKPIENIKRVNYAFKKRLIEAKDDPGQVIAAEPEPMPGRKL